MRPLNRVAPRLPVSAMKTYRVSTPLATHFRLAGSCAEVGCHAYQFGWVTRVDESTPLGQGQAQYIRRDSRRRFREEREPTGLTAFRFEPGQNCFALSEHRVKLDRPELFTTHRGDWRCLSDKYVHRRVDDWIDDLGTNQQRFAERIQRG